MKTLKYILIALIALPFVSCKKGENDPFLSFKSRKSRLAGEWELTDGSVTYTSVWSGTTSTSSVTYNGSTRTYSSSAGSSTSGYSEDWTFNKDGSYERVINDDGDVETSEGFWQFGNKSKTAEIKNKETVVYTETKNTNPNGISTAEGKGLWFDGVIRIDKLSSKEMVVIIDYDYTYTGSSSNIGEGTLTYTKK